MILNYILVEQDYEYLLFDSLVTKDHFQNPKKDGHQNHI